MLMKIQKNYLYLVLISLLITQLAKGDCDEGYKKQDGSCVQTASECDEGYIGDASSKSCIEKKNCSKYVSGNECLDACSNQNDIIKKIQENDSTYYKCDQVCDSDTFTQDDKKYCDFCPEGTLKGMKDKICKSKCEGQEVLDGNTCLENKSKCTKQFLVDGNTCQGTCSGDNFIMENDGSTYKICNSSCSSEQFSVENQEQKNCGFCPEGTLKGMKDKKCKSKCEGEEVLDGNTCLENKSKCLVYLVEDNTCSDTCQNDHFIMENNDAGSTYKICNSTCNSEQFSVENQEQKNCGFCPKGTLKGIKDKKCKSKCEGEEVLDGNTCLENKSKCTKKYLVEDNTCSDTCQNDHFIMENNGSTYNICNSTCNSEQFTVENQSQKNCGFCPEGTLKGMKDKKCKSKCEGEEVLDGNTCLENKSKCTKKYLVEDNTCSDTCQNDYFVLESNGSTYKICNSACNSEQFSVENQEQKNCGFCPKGTLKGIKDKKCKSKCEGEEVLDSDSCLEDKSSCKKQYLIDGKTCSDICSSDNFIIENNDTGSTYKICNSTCSSDAFSVENQSQKNCGFCPKDTFIVIKDKKCKQKCEGEEVLDGNTCLENKSSCKKNFLVDGKICTDTCSNNHFILENNDVGSTYKICNSICDSEQFTVENQSQKNCGFCPKGTLQGMKDKKCKKQCEGEEVLDGNVCLANKSSCKKEYLVDGNTCSDTCSSDNFIMENNDAGSTYKVCNSTCNSEQFSVDNQEQKNCGFCPKGTLKGIKDKKCKSKCEGEEVLDGDACLENKSSCKKQYLIDDKTCSDKCSSDHFIIENNDAGSTYKICNSTCGSDAFSVDNQQQKNCGFCPQGTLKGMKDKQCKLKCNETEKEENGKCVDNLPKCEKKFLVDYKLCEDTCPDNNFILENNDASLKYIFCNTECNLQKFIVENQKQKNCGFCPSGTLQGIKDNKCKLKCEDEEVKDGNTCLENKTKCKKQFLIDGNTCSDTCSSDNFLMENNDVDSSYKICNTVCNKQAFVVEKQLQKNCDFCPKGTLKGIKENKCKSKCEGEEVLDGNTCLENKSKCTKQYLVDGNTCSDTCSSDHFIMENNDVGSTYKICNSKCGLDSYTVDKQSQKNCGFCPEGTLKGMKDKKCKSKCEGQEVLNGNTCLENKSQCKKEFLVDGNTCSDTCSNDHFIMENNDAGSTYKICNSTCGSEQFVVEKQSQKNCGFCPSGTLKGIKDKKCKQKCEGEEVLDGNTCLEDKSKCTKQFLVDGKTCSTECPNNKFIIKQEQNEKYNACNSTCDSQDFTYKNMKYCNFCPTEAQQKSKSGSTYFCQLNCQSNFKQNDICLSTKNDCVKGYISYDGKQCIEKCDEKTQYSEIVQQYSQCKVCRDFISVDQVSKKVTCSPKCGDEEKYLVFEQNGVYFKQCVGKEGCSGKKMSSKYKNQCSEQCIKPEITNDDSCVESCPAGTKYSISENKCIKTACSAIQFESSDGSLCVDSCEKLFEIKDESKKVCKKCSTSELFSIDQSNRGVCKTVSQSSDERRSDMKNSIMSTLKEITSSKEVELATEVVKSFTKEVETVLNQISAIKEKSQDDQIKAQKEFNNILEVSMKLLKSVVNKNDLLNPITIGTSEVKVTSQLAQPGQKFKTQFTSDQISQGSVSLLEKNTDEANNAFDPVLLQVSFIKSNIYCKGSGCDKAPSLFTVSYPAQSRRRVLASAQAFQMLYNIPSGVQSERLICFSYDNQGVSTMNPAKQATSGQVSCEFQNSSALYIDENCTYIDKSYCNKEILEKQIDESEDNDDELSDGAIAGIVISVFFIIGIIVLVILYIIRKKNKIVSAEYLDQKQTENENYTTQKKVMDTENQLKS